MVTLNKKGTPSLPNVRQNGSHQTQSPSFDAMAELTEAIQKNEAILHGYEVLASEIVKNAPVEGTLGEPVTDSLSGSSEDKIISGWAKAEAALDQNFWEIRQRLERKKATAAGKHEKLPTREERLLALELDKRAALELAGRRVTAPSLNLRLSYIIWCEKTVKGVVDVLKERLHRLEELKGHAEANFHHLLLNHYHGLPPKNNALHNPAIFWGLIGLLSIVEIFINLAAFQDINIGDNNVAATVLASIFAITQSLSAKALGVAWEKGIKRGILKYLGTTFLCCVLACLLRFGMENGGMIVKASLMVLNCFFVGLTVFLGHSHAQNLAFFSYLRQRHSLTQRIKKLHSQIEQIEDAHKNRCEEVELEIKEQARVMEDEAKESLEKNVSLNQEALLKLDGYEKNFHKRLKDTEQSALAQYRHLNHSARTSTGHPPVKRWHNPLHSLNGQAMNCAVTLLLGAMFCWGCGETQLPETHIEVLIDQTDTTHGQNVPSLCEHITKTAFPNGIGHEWGETSIALSPIGETSTQATQIVALAASEPYWTRNEQKHRSNEKAFREGLQNALDSLTKPGTGMNHSFIHRNFFYRLTELGKKPDRKIMLSWSDLIANDQYANFYRYAENPKGIWLAKEELVAKMESEYPLPDLTGITIINIHHPSKRWDELHEVSKRFWEYYWSSKGAKVEFYNNAPAKFVSTQTQTNQHPPPK